MIERILNILFTILWLPICLILVGAVMLWAILLTWYNYIVDFIKKIFK
tara:strand:+ start:841 stop:984 length:144 start_codon:yes stop_codon:yes gene_type:complete